MRPLTFQWSVNSNSTMDPITLYLGWHQWLNAAELIPDVVQSLWLVDASRCVTRKCLGALRVDPQAKQGALCGRTKLYTIRKGIWNRAPSSDSDPIRISRSYTHIFQESS